MLTDVVDILAVLWEGPANRPRLLEALAERRGAQPNVAVVDGELWFLAQSGMIRHLSDLDDRFILSSKGSKLLATAANEVVA
jgi:hypothetical protein